MALRRNIRDLKNYFSDLRFDPAELFHLHWLQTLRILVVPLTFGGALLLGILAGRLDNPLLAVAAACLPFILPAAEFLLNRESVFPVLILFVAAFVPIGFSSGTGSKLVLSLLVTILFVVLWVLKMLVQDKKIQLYPHFLNWPLLGFIIITLISLVWSNLFRDPMVAIWPSFPVVQIAAAIVMIMLPMAFLLTFNYIQKEGTLKWLAGIMLGAGVVGAIRQYGTITGLPVNVGGLFNMWIIVLSIGLALFNKKFRPWQAALLYLLAGAWIVWGLVLHISWLAGWLPGMIGLGVLAFMHSKKTIALLFIVVLLVIAANFDYIIQTVLPNETTESGLTRLHAWEMNWKITSQHLLFGTGPAGYAAYYMSYFPADGTATHSNLIDVVAQTGLTGLSACLAFFAGLIWYGYRLCLRLKGRGDFLEGLANAALAGTAGGLVMMAFGDWMFPFAYTQTIAGFDYAVYNWIFMGTLPVIDRLTKKDAIPHA